MGYKSQRKFAKIKRLIKTSNKLKERKEEKALFYRIEYDSVKDRKNMNVGNLIFRK